MPITCELTLLFYHAVALTPSQLNQPNFKPPSRDQTSRSRFTLVTAICSWFPAKWPASTQAFPLCNTLLNVSDYNCQTTMPVNSTGNSIDTQNFPPITSTSDWKMMRSWLLPYWMVVTGSRCGSSALCWVVTTHTRWIFLQIPKLALGAWNGTCHKTPNMLYSWLTGIEIWNTDKRRRMSHMLSLVAYWNDG